MPRKSDASPMAMIEWVDVPSQNQTVRDTESKGVKKEEKETKKVSAKKTEKASAKKTSDDKDNKKK